jgi:hypothetical protein
VWKVLKFRDGNGSDSDRVVNSGKKNPAAGEREKRKITVERNQIRISAVQREHYWQRRRMEQKMEKIGGESAEACTATSGLGKYCADGWPL